MNLIYQQRLLFSWTIIGLLLMHKTQGFLFRLSSNCQNSLPSRSSSATTTTRLHDAIDVASVDQARTAFFIWLFGASGGAGIARSAFPRMYRNFQETRRMKSDTVAKGEQETIGISPLCGYPQDIPVNDVLKIVKSSKKNLSVGQIVKKYPIEGNFLSAQGYLTYAAFQQAHSNANPLAVRAIFDALNAGSDVCNPFVAQEAIDEIANNPKVLASKVLSAKLKGYAAIFALLFLLALADYEAFVIHLREGWFPEWPGLSNLPGSLFDSETGLSAIPNYWLGEYK